MNKPFSFRLLIADAHYFQKDPDLLRFKFFSETLFYHWSYRKLLMATLFIYFYFVWKARGLNVLEFSFLTGDQPQVFIEP